jgi:elongation factor Ts
MMSDYKPSAGEIKELREKTLAGFQDCKNALVETGGNLQDAIDLIRKKGLSVAAKKAHRDASEGLISAVIGDDGKSGAMIELNCESDFVAKTEQFQELAKSLAGFVLLKCDNGEADGTSLYDTDYADGKTLKTMIDELIGKIGENMGLKKVVKYSLNGAGVVQSYIHPPGKVGVLIGIGGDEGADTEKCKELAHELALQVAFSDPSYISPEDIPEAILAKEREIAEAKAREQGKPEHIVPKIAEGMIRKYYEDECLLEQAFAKDNNMSVKDVVSQSGIPGGKVTAFYRFALK